MVRLQQSACSNAADGHGELAASSDGRRTVKMQQAAPRLQQRWPTHGAALAATQRTATVRLQQRSWLPVLVAKSSARRQTL
jgi:hypothetical protein